MIHKIGFLHQSMAIFLFSVSTHDPSPRGTSGAAAMPPAQVMTSRNPDKVVRDPRGASLHDG